MKKMCSVIMAVLMLVCLAVPVMAAAVPSPGKDPEPQEGTITKEDGSEVDANDPEEVKKYIEVTVSATPTDKVDGYNSVSSFDVSFKNGAVSADVTFYVPGIKKGSTVKVRIFINGQWVDVDAVVIDDNLVRVNVPASGKVEILTKESGSNVDPAKPGDNNGNGTGGNVSGNNTSGSNTSGTSPKTGESAAFPMACALAVVFGAAAVGAGCKAKRVK